MELAHRLRRSLVSLLDIFECLYSEKFLSLVNLLSHANLLVTETCRHVGEDAKLVVLKDAGHAINAEKPKEMLRHLKAFLLDPPPPSKLKTKTDGHEAN